METEIQKKKWDAKVERVQYDNNKWLLNRKTTYLIKGVYGNGHKVDCFKGDKPVRIGGEKVEAVRYD